MSSEEQIVEATGRLGDVQDVDVNYYVLVPFTTADAAKWAAGYITEEFDCHVVSVAAVDQDALVVADFRAHASPPASVPSPPEPEQHECQRCSSDEWTWCDYRGCSECRPEQSSPGQAR